ncbi:hypothetical protein HOLleu_08120 [Holothuria leucospilota]|uniref:Uncharacterized protein n=1 Tax=Holothuria leucospilota TaxID=206669 RepID=A0A9Q1CH11_HOLLE|nr:hypothetical protein HOLleu_08120 [Holothuria leucospilota]
MSPYCCCCSLEGQDQSQGKKVQKRKKKEECVENQGCTRIHRLIGVYANSDQGAD